MKSYLGFVSPYSFLSFTNYPDLKSNHLLHQVNHLVLKISSQMNPLKKAEPQIGAPGRGGLRGQNHGDSYHFTAEQGL